MDRRVIAQLFDSIDSLSETKPQSAQPTLDEEGISQAVDEKKAGNCQVILIAATNRRVCPVLTSPQQ